MDMLIALLLSLLPSSLPLADCQDPAPAAEPFLQWNGETEDSYRRALHLWQVRGKPGEAADILLKLADTPEVTQVAGQASWVLVLAAQALAEADRRAEAFALIPGIERGARGSPLQDRVSSELSTLRETSGVSQQSLDPEFMETLVEILRTPVDKDRGDVDIFRRVTSYRRAVLPYLLEIIRTRPGPDGQTVVSRSFEYGLSMADREFVDALTEAIAGMSTLNVLSTVIPHHPVALDELAERERVRFWGLLALHSEDDIVRLAKRALSQRAFESGIVSAIETVKVMLQDQDPRLDEEFLWFRTDVVSPTDSRVLLLIELTRSTNPAVRACAMDRLSKGEFLDLLAQAAASGNRADAVRYLACLAAEYNSGLSVSDEIGEQPSLVRILRLEGLSGVQIRFNSAAPPDPASVHAKLAQSSFLSPLMTEPHLRTLVALAAAGVRDEAAFNMCYSGGVPDDEVAICLALQSRDQRFLPAAFKASLRSLVASYSAGEYGWSLLRSSAPEMVDGALVRSMRRDLRERKFSEFINYMGRPNQLEDLLALASDGVLSPQQIPMALHHYGWHQERWWTALAKIMEIIDRLPLNEKEQALRDLDENVARLPASAADELRSSDLVALLELLNGVERYKPFSYEFLVNNWSIIGASVVQEFGTTLDRLKWVIGRQNADPKMQDLVVYYLERGAPISWFRFQYDDLAPFIPKDSPELLHAARILLARPDHESQRAALLALARGKELAPTLWQEIEPTWDDPQLATRAAIALQNAPDREALLSHMISAWSLPGLQERASLATLLAATADPRVAPLLLGAIADSDPKIAAAAQEGLERLKEIAEQRAFWESWQATGVGGSPTAALLRQIQSKNKEVRLSAIRALGALKAPEALPLLISLLEDPDPMVAAAARAGLAWLNAESSPK